MTELARLVAAIEAEGAEVTISKIRAVGDEGEKTGKRVKDGNKESANSFKELTSIVLKYVAAYVSVKAVADSIIASVKLNREFTASISELSAITGAAGENLNFLAEESLRYGRTTVFSASQAATAFKLVASAKPDLLANKEALSQVTGEALTLATAAGVELPEAATTLGSALNQFQEDADSAARFINVLAAGAKFGASEIADTSLALKDSGTVANAAGVSFEELNAAIQALSTVSIKGSQAGTNLRNIILKLQNQTQDGFNPAVVGLSQALANLRESELTTTELTKLFGLESVTAAKALIEQADSVQDLTNKLTGTNTAYEQSAIITDNLDGDMKRLSNSVQGLALQTGDRLNPSMRLFAQTATEVINAWAGVNEEFSDSPRAFTLIGDGLIFVARTAKVIEVGFRAVGEVIGAVMATIVRSIGNTVEVTSKLLAGDFAGAMETLQTKSRETSKSIGESLGENISSLGDELLSFEARLQNVDRNIAKQKEFNEAIKESVALQQEASNAQTSGGLVGEKLELGKDSKTDEELERQRQSQLNRLASLQEYLGHVDEVEEYHRQQRLDLLTELEEQNIITDQQKRDLTLEVERKHQENLNNIVAKGIEDRATFERSSLTNQAKFVFGYLASITQGTANHNKTMFKINKAAAIANAIINTAQGATKALEWGFPLGPIFAGVIIAAGLAQIASIKSQQFEGGGAGTAPSLVGKTGTPTVTGTVPTTPQDESSLRGSPLVEGADSSSGPRAFVQLVIQDGAVVTDIDGLMERLNKEVANGKPLSASAVVV